MPERRGRRVPDKPTPYSRAAKYESEEASEQPYDAMQQAIYETPCNLSTYRIRLGEQLEYHVAVLGEAPGQEFQRRIEEILSSGECVTLPDEVLAYLHQRRAQQSKEGQWVERHHFPRRRPTR